MLKFQFPSPHHTDKSGVYWIRPYLELLRLINELDGLSKAEIAAFVTQLVHINLYETIKQKIVNFRQNYSKNKGKTNYKKLFDEIFTAQIEEIYQSQIAKKQYKTRESDELSRKKFIETKKGNHLDYADAAIRYLRETHLVSLKYNRIYVPPEKAAEVNFILENISREPFYVTDKKQYLAYQADSQQPPLLSDNHSALLSALEPLVDSGEFPHLAQQSIPQLKTIYHQLIQTRRKLLLEKQIQQLQNYQEFEDIVGIYQAIKNKELADAPVWMEWNTWRALTMLDDGEIVGNFSVDDIGVPFFTALGNIADIICFYTDYDLTVEVTLSSGATQFKMETDSVPRHFAKHKEKYGKPTYTLFIAQSLHHDTITYFFSLHKIFLKGFGGYAQIIPLTLQDFQTILEQAYTAQEKPTSDDIHRFLKTACDLAKQAEDEEIWYKSVQNLTHTWLTMWNKVSWGWRN